MNKAQLANHLKNEIEFVFQRFGVTHVSVILTENTCVVSLIADEALTVDEFITFGDTYGGTLMFFQGDIKKITNKHVIVLAVFSYLVELRDAFFEGDIQSAVAMNSLAKENEGG